MSTKKRSPPPSPKAGAPGRCARRGRSPTTCTPWKSSCAASGATKRVPGQVSPLAFGVISCERRRHDKSAEGMVIRSIAPLALFFPGQCKSSLFLGAVEQIQIDEILVWNPRISRKCFKVIDHIGFESNGDRLLQTLHIWIPLCRGKIILFSHFWFSQYGCCSLVPALRAEITLIDEPLLRKQ